MKKYFIYTRMRLPDGRIAQKYGNIPSGSSFTQLIGSIVNRIVCRAIFTQGQVEIVKEKYLGDDALILIKDSKDQSLLRDAEDEIAKKLGFTLNYEKKKKTWLNGTIEFLNIKENSIKGNLPLIDAL